MDIHTPSDLRDYFSAIATALGCSFQYGNSERILNRQLSQLKYPVLWLEVPEIQLVQMGGLRRRFSGAFLLLANADVDDWAGQDSRHDEMFLLAHQVVQTMNASAQESPAPFDFELGGIAMEPKHKWSADDDWGWRMEFALTGGACEFPDCCDEEGGGVLLPNTPGNQITAPGGSVAVGAGKLVYAIVVLPTPADNTLRIGTTPGGDEIMSEETITADQAWTTNAQHYFETAGSLYFSVSESTTVIVYVR